MVSGPKIPDMGQLETLPLITAAAVLAVWSLCPNRAAQLLPLGSMRPPVRLVRIGRAYRCGAKDHSGALHATPTASIGSRGKLGKRVRESRWPQSIQDQLNVCPCNAVSPGGAKQFARFSAACGVPATASGNDLDLEVTSILSGVRRDRLGVTIQERAIHDGIWVQSWVQVADRPTSFKVVSCAGSTNVLTATNQEVASSSPAGPAFLPFELAQSTS